MAGKVQGKQKRPQQTGDKSDLNTETEPEAPLRLARERETLEDSICVRAGTLETPTPAQTEPEEFGDYNFDLPVYSPPLSVSSPIYHDSAIEMSSTPFTSENFPFSWEMLDPTLDTTSQTNRQPRQVDDTILDSEAAISGRESYLTSWDEPCSLSSWMSVFASLRKS